MGVSGEDERLKTIIERPSPPPLPPIKLKSELDEGVSGDGRKGGELISVNKPHRNISASMRMREEVLNFSLARTHSLAAVTQLKRINKSPCAMLLLVRCCCSIINKVVQPRSLKTFSVRGVPRVLPLTHSLSWR